MGRLVKLELTRLTISPLEVPINDEQLTMCIAGFLIDFIYLGTA